MKINQFSRVLPGKKNMSPIVQNLHNNFLTYNTSESKSFHLNEYDSDLNLYHFGGVWNLKNYFKAKKGSQNIVVFHGSDLHMYLKDLTFLNRIKGKINYYANRYLILKCDKIIVVSNSLIQYIPSKFQEKVFVLNLGVDLQLLNTDSKNSKFPFNQAAFVNNNNRGIKNLPLAKEYCKNNRLKLLNLGGLSYPNFLSKLKECSSILMTSFQEGSPNVIKESILLGLTIISVDVGDCIDLIQRFGGKEISFNGIVRQEYSPRKAYNSIKYLSIEKTINNLFIIFNS